MVQRIRKGITGLRCLVVFVCWIGFPDAGTAADQLILNGDFEAPELIGGWEPREHVTLEVVEVEGASGKKALKVAWTELEAFQKWAAAGGLLKNVNELLEEPLLRDTRYRLSCRLRVEHFEVSGEATAFLKNLPKGQYDSPTIGVGCYGGTWNSGMLWMAYDISELGTWQELESEFVTPYTGSLVFAFLLDAYPHFRSPMKSSGVLYLDDVVLEAVPPRVGFTRTKTALEIDGDLKDWWRTNPAVITRDMLVSGSEEANENASGVVYTMWDEGNLYVAALVIDDKVGEGDSFLVKLGSEEYVIEATGKTKEAVEGVVVASRAVEGLGSSADIYRIVSQYGDEVAGRNGYVIEAAIAWTGEKPDEVAFEIRDRDRGSKETRVLRYPRVRGAGEVAETAYANEKGELRGGERPVYAITDAANPRDRARVLSVKNVASHLVAKGRLGYPTAVFQRGEGDQVDAIVSWSTNMPASGFVEIGEDQHYGSRIEGVDAVDERGGVAMRAILRGLKEGQKYHYRVRAVAGTGGEVVYSRDRVLNTRAVAVSGVEKREIPLRVISLEGSVTGAGSHSVTSGVPFPRGHLGSVEELRLVDHDGAAVAAQFAATSKWPDGSIRWALADFQSTKGAGEKFSLQYGSGVETVAVKSPLRVEEDTESVRVDTGAIEFRINRNDFNLLDEVRLGDRLIAGGGRLVMMDEEGVEYVARKSDVVEVEELGPVRICVRVAGKYLNASGEPFFDYDLRIHAHAGSATVRVNHGYTCRLKERVDPAKNRNIPSQPEAVKIRAMWMELLVKSRGKERVTSGSFGMAGGASTNEIELGGPAGEKGIEIRQITARRASIDGSESRKSKALERLPGWMAAGGVAAGVRHFRELYPKAMSLMPGEQGIVFRIDTLPPIRAEDYPSEEGTVEDHVWGYLRGGRYRLRRGEGRGHEVLFDFDVGAGTAASEGKALTAAPLFAAAPPEWYCESGAIGKVLPRNDRFADYDSFFAKGVKSMRLSQEAEPAFGRNFGRLGMRNFGDNFGSDGPNWDNLEYDFGYSCLLQFLRSGDVSALRMGREAVLHNMDVDIVNIRDGYEFPCGHQGDHSMNLAGLGHTWCEGLWTYYFLTGDRQAARKALGVSNTVAHRSPGLAAAGAPGAAGARDYGWSVVALMAAYGATADPIYLNAAKEIEEVAVRTQHPFRGGWLHRLSPGHCFHAPAHTGRVYFMHEIVLAGQVRFHQETGDPDVGQCLVNAVNGIVDEYIGQLAGGFPGGGYTSCPFMTFPGAIRTAHVINRKHSFEVLPSWEPVYYVDAVWPGTNLHERIETILGEGGPPRFADSLGRGKGFAQQTRWTPNRMYWILESGFGEN
ncbi:MAG: hypothetical protein GY903_27235 [Fuerstiella sp.]|nr:hypothetical protein [Planctomycetota bacterium]MCP4858193.1 hypothetical protein [Fuerstiella sp.]